MLPDERRSLILKTLEAQGSVRVTHLSAQLSVTEETVRRDLDELARQHLIKRTHGGAIKAMGTGFELPYPRRRAEMEREKKQIAEVSAALISEADTIIMDASTTVLYLCEQIRRIQQLTVLTNSLQVVMELSGRSNHHIILTGGSVGPGLYSLVGPIAQRTIDEHNVDMAFISCRGVSVEKGVTDYDGLMVELKKQMIQSAQQVVLMADHTKFDSVGFVRVASIEAIDTLVTDDGTPRERLVPFEEAGIRVIAAK